MYYRPTLWHILRVDYLTYFGLGYKLTKPKTAFMDFQLSGVAIKGASGAYILPPCHEYT